MRRLLVGLVTKNSGIKTIKVRVERKERHPKYGKIVTSHKQYLVHVEGEAPAIGSQVTIGETKPISKLKTWELINTVKQAE